MTGELELLREQAEAGLRKAGSEEELQAIRTRYLGRKGLLTGLLRNWLVAKFSNPANIESPDLKEGEHPAIWRDGPSTGIMIESVWRWPSSAFDGFSSKNVSLS